VLVRLIVTDPVTVSEREVERLEVTDNEVDVDTVPLREGMTEFETVEEIVEEIVFEMVFEVDREPETLGEKEVEVDREVEGVGET